MSLADHGLKHESRHRYLIIDYTGPRGPVLCNACQWHHCTPEGSPAKAGSHSASNCGGGTDFFSRLGQA